MKQEMAVLSRPTAMPKPTAHYFVDESGDRVLFGAQSRSLLLADAVDVHHPAIAYVKRDCRHDADR